MALKGHTKIQLFDAKTGELVQETNDDNMVTNAISRLINPPLDFLVGSGINLNTVLSKTLPIQTTGMAGVMVFSNKIEENANHVLADNSDVSIGHAGSAYSGTNTKRGTYNANESKALSNGYRHVWDFSTDRANGDISCVCLTSKIGGDTGIDGNNDSKYGRQYIGGLIGSWSSDDFFPAGIIEKGKFCGAYINGNTINLNYYQGFDSDKIPLAKSSNVGSTLYKSVSITCENYNVSGTNTKFYTDDEGILKVWDRKYTNLGSSIYQINIHYASVNILNGTKVDDKIITVDFSTFPAGRYRVGTTGYGADSYFYLCSAMKNYIVAWARLANPENSSYPWELVFLDYNGKFVKYYDGTHWNSTNDETCYDSYNNRLYVSAGTSPKWLPEDGEIVRGVQIDFASGGLGRGVYCYKNIFPFYIYGYSSSSTKGFGLYIDYTYLATINNLATTVTKTNGQTMKITYDITET